MIARRFFIIATTVLTFCVLSVSPAIAAGEVPVSVNCNAEVEQGNYFVATVEIGSVSNLNAAEFILEFDPDVISLESTSAGNIGDNEFSMIFNQLGPGRYKFLGYAGISTINGAGTLVTLSLYALEGGTTSITLSNGILSGMDEEIPSSWTNSSVTVPSDQQTAPDTGGSSGSSIPPPADDPDEGTATEEATQTSGDETAADDTEEEGVVITTSYDDDTGDSGVQIIQETETVTLDESGQEIIKDDATDSESAEITNSEKSEITAEGEFKWPILGGIIGGVVVIVGLILYANRNRGYLG